MYCTLFIFSYETTLQIIVHLLNCRKNYIYWLSIYLFIFVYLIQLAVMVGYLLGYLAYPYFFFQILKSRAARDFFTCGSAESRTMI